MFGIRYLKTRPSEYVILFRRGRARKHGAGLAFFYYSPSASLVVLPADSRDVPFIFQETTNDYQSIDIQGQLTYRVKDALRLAAMLDFSIDARGVPLGDGAEKLTLRLTNLVQLLLREKIQSYSLRDSLSAGPELARHVSERIKDAPVFAELGLEALDFTLLRISPSPEMARALEAAARETLLKDADQAIYMRRNFAVEQERQIKENELQTQIAVEQKNRQIREEQMRAEIAVQEQQKVIEERKMETAAMVEERKAEIERGKLESQTALEEQRKKLVAAATENTVARARAEAEAARTKLGALQTLSPELLEILALQQLDSRTLISRAFRDLARNSEKIGTLNLSPELLESLIKADGNR
ncbi:MAG: band 7 protein [Leptospirales bacterium]|nr:band 7 protein [Leptospirales bacterium]